MSDTKYIIDRDTLVDIADSVRAKASTTDDIRVDELAQAITDIPSGGAEVYNDGYFGIPYPKDVIINGNVTLPQYLYRACTHMESLTMEDVTKFQYTTIFYGCSSLKQIIAPKLINIANASFSGCGELDNCDFSSATSIGQQAFQLGNAINLSFPKVTSISVSAFNKCQKLKTLNIPLVTTLGQQACDYCEKLESVYAPSLVTIGLYGFRGCTSLRDFKFYSTPTTFPNNVFSVCSNLLDIYVPWSEGEVSGAPWGATNATVHYNWTPEETE